ncbi:unnamed protein product [Arctogadus glacialis]
MELDSTFDRIVTRCPLCLRRISSEFLTRMNAALSRRCVVGVVLGATEDRADESAQERVLAVGAEKTLLQAS